MHVYKVFVRTGRGLDDPKREVVLSVIAESRHEAERFALMEVVNLGESAELVDTVNVYTGVPQVLGHTWLWAD